MDEMKLLDEIIENVTVAKEPVADTLRRCLVLAYRLRNDTLKAWVEKELNGYGSGDELPSYRESPGIAKGIFLGGWGSQLNNQPLAPSILKKEHRHWANTVRLTQPIAAYDNREENDNAMLPWPADLVVLYQSKFFEGMALNRAWIEIPASMMTSLVDTVRTRILTFALQIQQELNESEGDPANAISPAEVERIVNVTILGGHNVIGDVREFKAQTVTVGDIKSLKAALAQLGVNDGELRELEGDLQEEAVVGADEKKLGERTAAWVKKTAKRLGEAGLKIGGSVAEEMLKQAIQRYFGSI